MPFAEAFMTFPLPPFADLVQGALVLALLASTLLFFRPLLSGLVRALVVSLRPRRPAKTLARPA